MDDIDRKLVNILCADGRTSYAELARQVGLTPPSVQDRVAKLERTGVIVGYRAVADPAKVGLNVTAAIGIGTQSGREYAQIASEFEKIEEIESCYFVAGRESYLIKVRVPAMSDLQDLLERIGAIPGVAETRTTIAITTHWEGRPQEVVELE